MIFLYLVRPRSETFELSKKYGFSQIIFLERSRKPTFIMKVFLNLILHILVYK